MLKSYKYRLYPTKNQVNSLNIQLEGHLFLYNQALAQKKETYKTTGKGISYSKQATTLLPCLRKENNNILLCNYSSLQQTLRRLDKTFKAFFRRVKVKEEPGYPRFKSKERFNTINYAKFGDGCNIKENRLYIQNAGYIKVKWHRQIAGIIKTLSVIRRNGKWYVSFIVEENTKPLAKTGKIIGIDVGLNAFIATNTGDKIIKPKHLKNAEKELTKAHQRISRRKKGSNRRRKAVKLLAKKYEKVVNRRIDFYHKTSAEIVKHYDGFAVENLNIKNMVKNHRLAKSIHDAGWGIFLNILKYKAESAGKWYMEVSPNGTSQICSSCGNIVKKSLGIRIHNCPHCGLSLDRDTNAAINILARTEPSVLAAKFAAPPRSRLL